MFISIILGLMADGIAISGRCLNHFLLLLTCTLHHRAKVICSSPELLQQEE